MPDSGPYSWDAGSLRFRNSAGKFVANESVKGAVRDYSDAIRQRIVAETAKLNAGTVKLATWQRSVQGLIKQGATAGGIIAAGGADRFDQRARERVQREVAHQYGYFRGLVAEVKAGTLSGDALAARAGMYAGTATRSYEATRREVNGVQYREEHRFLGGSSQNCEPCKAHASRGWVPVGTLPEIGDACDCKSNCNCTFSYRLKRTAQSPVSPSDVVEIPETESIPSTRPGRDLPTELVLPGKPIGQRLAAYTDGDKHIDDIISLGSSGRKARKDYREATFRIDNLPESIRNAKDEVEVKRLRGVYERSIEERGKARDELERHNADVRAKLPEIIGVPNPHRWEHVGTGTAEPTIAANIKASDDFINPLFSRGLEDSTKIRWTAKKKPDYRDNYDDKQINSGVESRPAIAIHERGHVIEHKLPSIGNRSLEFLKYRVRDEQAKPMGSNYAEHEIGYDDDFRKFFGDAGRYAGKKYTDQNASEILSMGLQALYEDPVGFAQKDPEYAKYVIGVLRGPLR